MCIRDRNIPRHQLESHMTSNQQQHLLLVMKDLHRVKSKLNETEAKLDETEAKLNGTEAKLNTAVWLLSQPRRKETDKETNDFIISCTGSKRLMANGDTVEITMSNFSEYHRSGKVWHSPPFYYREGYKMCLSVYANGVGEGAGTHVSVGILLLREELDDRLEWPMKPYPPRLYPSFPNTTRFYVSSWNMAANNKESEVSREQKFCDLVSCRQHLANDCLTMKVELQYTSCLLYTSLSPRDATLSRMPSSA